MENESIQTLLTRRSVRKYKPEHITEEEMETLFEVRRDRLSERFCTMPLV